jgi:hypothetical protein
LEVRVIQVELGRALISTALISIAIVRVWRTVSWTMPVS